MKQRTKYVLATIATIIFIGLVTIGEFKNISEGKIPTPFFANVLLVGIMATFFFGVSESAYKKLAPLNIKEMPMTCAGAVLSIYSGAFAFIQLMLTMQN